MIKNYLLTAEVLYLQCNKQNSCLFACFFMVVICHQKLKISLHSSWRRYVIRWTTYSGLNGYNLLVTYLQHTRYTVHDVCLFLLGITLWWTKFSCSYAKEVYISAFCVTYFILEKLEYGNVVWPKAQASINRAIWRMNHYPTLSIWETSWVIQWIEIYLVNSVNYLLNN